MQEEGEEEEPRSEAGRVDMYWEDGEVMALATTPGGVATRPTRSC